MPPSLPSQYCPSQALPSLYCPVLQALPSLYCPVLQALPSRAGGGRSFSRWSQRKGQASLTLTLTGASTRRTGQAATW